MDSISTDFHLLQTSFWLQHYGHAGCNRLIEITITVDFGSRPSDHYFGSVCLFVCLCRVFLNRLWSDFDQTWTYVICLGL